MQFYTEEKKESLHLMFFCQYVKKSYQPLSYIVLLESHFDVQLRIQV